MLDDRRFPELLAAAKRGDQAAIGVLYRALQPRVLRFLRAAEPRHADDLSSEVWMAVARGLATFEGDAVGFRAWVFSIARRRTADHRRRNMRHDVALVETEVLERVEGAADTAGDAVGRLTGEEAARLVLSVLNEEQAEVILLRVLGDLGVEETAQALGRTANWVRVTQHRALRKLAERLGPRIDVIR